MAGGHRGVIPGWVRAVVPHSWRFRCHANIWGGSHVVGLRSNPAWRHIEVDPTAIPPVVPSPVTKASTREPVVAKTAAVKSPMAAAMESPMAAPGKPAVTTGCQDDGSSTNHKEQDHNKHPDTLTHMLSPFSRSRHPPMTMSAQNANVTH